MNRRARVETPSRGVYTDAMLGVGVEQDRVDERCVHLGLRTFGRPLRRG
jgi:hypothetical protein